MLEQQTSTGQDRNSAKIILIVEDDADIGTFLIQVVHQETPYRAMLATNGVQALKIVSSLKPDLCLLDYLLPGMNGLELYDQMQKVETLQRIPTLFMSAHLPTQELEQRHVASIQKPFELDELLYAIERLLVQ